MLSFSFIPFPILQTQRLELRRIEENDVHDLFLLRSDKNVMAHIDRPVAKSPDDVTALIKKIIELEESNDAINWAITLRPDRRLIGNICIWNISKEDHRGELGYMLHPAFHRQGLMQEAVSAVLDYGFGVLKLHSIEAIVTPKNIPSIKILERNRFVREAYFKENHFSNGQYTDTAVYSLLTSLT